MPHSGGLYRIPAAPLLSNSSLLGLSPMSEARPVLPSSSPEESLSGTVVGRFRILERLGKGGMGEVYRAEDTRLKRTVALKRLAPALRADSVYRRRFQEEAERASRFSDLRRWRYSQPPEERRKTSSLMVASKPWKVTTIGTFR